MPGWSAACFRPLRKRQQCLHGHNNPSLSMTLSTEERQSSVTEDKRGISVVELLKNEGSTLGLIISGGIDKGAPPKICNLRPESIAYRSDALAVGDHIISVNGIRTSKLRHEEIVNLLKNAESKVILEVEYEIPPSPSDMALHAYPKVIQVTVAKENGSFGFTLRGGACVDKSKSRPLTITHVRPGGPADREGTIKVGDRILSIDSINLVSATLQEALAILKKIDKEALISIEYDISIIDAVQNASGPLLVEIDKMPCSQLGISVTHISELIVIENIKQASIAERCGALHVGDQILAIDDTKLDNMTPVEAMHLLNTSLGEVIKLEILPANHTTLCKLQELTLKKGFLQPAVASYLSSYPPSCYNTISSVGANSVIHSNKWQISEFSSYKENSGKISYKKHLSDSAIPHASNISLLSSTTSSVAFHGHVYHSERMQVNIFANHQGYGFQLEGATFTTELMSVPLVISSIDPIGPAGRTGVIQVGDRVLAVNGQSTEGLTAEEVMHYIKQLHPRITLEIEFDIAESVVPSTGTFLVKLPKRSGGLGITVSSTKQQRESDEPLIISEIKKGSIAHRIGTIQPGDKLLAINSIHTKNCSVEDVAEIIEACEDIVPLQIQKDDSFCDEPCITGSVVYTLELIRHGGPLGITISGTEEPFDPIIITGLTEGGLAERTEALHAGDRLIAINGQSLRGKPLSEAIALLQNSGDVINLKISKNALKLKTPLKEKQEEAANDTSVSDFVTSLPSVDSAVESWNSCALDLPFNGSKYYSSHIDHKPENEYYIKKKYLPLEQGKINLENQAAVEWDVEEWDVKTHSTQNSHSYPASPSSTSENDKADWSFVLEDLETCGQSQLLRQIEQSIMGSNSAVSGNQQCDLSNTLPPSHECSIHHSGLLERENFDEQHSDIELYKQGNGINKNSLEQKMNMLNCTTSECLQNQHIGIDSFLATNPSCQPSCPHPLPVEVHNVTLFKDQVYEDFGFSVSDGLYDRGVYVNRIRPGGPADLSCLIQPYDRILQVNDIKTDDYDCCMTVPLIASSEDKINLVITRVAYGNQYTPGWNNSFPSWVTDREKDDCTAAVSLNNDSRSLTKTL